MTQQRPSTPDTPEASRDDRASLAYDLRVLRMRGGDPVLAKIATKVELSNATLSAAFNGSSLPSEKTLYRLARYFEVSPQPLLRKRARILAAEGRTRQTDAEGVQPGIDPATAPPAQPTGPAPAQHTGDGAQGNGLPKTPPEPAEPEPHGRRPRSRLLFGTAIAAGLVTAATIGGITAMTLSPGTARDSDEHSEAVGLTRHIDPKDGADPSMTTCSGDAVVVKRQSAYEEQVEVKLVHSAACHAYWGTVERFDQIGMKTGQRVIMRIFPGANSTDARALERKVENRRKVTSPMLVMTGTEQQVCGLGSVTVDGELRPAGSILCVPAAQ
ncbi:helix-turn-helix domain-containing protein [Brevibacterium sp. 50QC2O2]|uniref:helix-turn-helix domain-containing protein n=1 Tax=Brevibacterium sp. 50QC2O2 TaxID=2968459 RepID=UPI00211CD9D2|nr:helix-turn-helix transcriptional regulator [Brevibacterium sp. 50QC2O2]MCQ9387642.1 helix-turn-helix domain-containing protein [Brevibacterium sp. 50QC2O2]